MSNAVGSYADAESAAVQKEIRDALLSLVEQQKIANQLAAYSLSGGTRSDEIESIMRGMRAFHSQDAQKKYIP